MRPSSQELSMFDPHPVSARGARAGRVVAALLAIVLAACVTAPLADRLRPAPGESLALVLSADGVQVYECRARQGAGHAWVFVAPEADLFDRRGHKVGRHGAGPSWQVDDGSRLVATLLQRVDAQQGAIPWLLMSARPDGGNGVLSDVTSIQRLHTQGGVAPDSGCHRGTAGSTTRVRYLAEYHFFKARY
jgi:hypothetical protein